MPVSPVSRARGPSDPRLALAFVYVAMFGHLGIIMPFLAPWLREKGYGPAGIGLLMALPPLFKILAHWNWGRWADRSGRRRELLTAAGLLSAISLAAVVTRDAGFSLIALIALYGFGRAPILPFVEATALEQSERRRFAYGPTRLWGSISFMVVSSAYGALGGRVSYDGGLVLAAAMLGAVALVAAGAFPDPDHGEPASEASDDDPERWAGDGRPRMLRLFTACALMQVSHGAYYTFYSIHLQDLGYGRTAIGLLWAFGVLCEVLLFTRMDALVMRFGSTRVMHACLGIAAVRWLLIGATGDPLVLVSAQTLHAATYAGFHVAAIRRVFRGFGKTHRARGQTLYSGMTYGLGMFLGAIVAGALAGVVGLPTLFGASAVVALIAMPVLGRPDRPAPSR